MTPKAILDLLHARADWALKPFLSRIPASLTPEFFSYSRIFSASLIFAAAMGNIPGRFFICVVLWFLAKATDIIDGSLARLRKSESRLGELIDLLADKFLWIAVALALLSAWPQTYFLAYFIWAEAAMISLSFIFFPSKKYYSLWQKVRRELEAAVLLTILLGCAMIKQN